MRGSYEGRRSRQSPVFSTITYERHNVTLNKAIKKAKDKLDGTLWEGPESDGVNGGVTQSLLGKFKVCRERTRLLVVEGYRTRERFNSSIEYGNMWHLCEECLASGQDWTSSLRELCNGLLRKYPNDQEDIDKWYNCCKIQFPVYVGYWKTHPDVKSRTPVYQEEAFCVPYELPTGRVVHLKGKFDSVDRIKINGKEGVYLQENKTKGDPKERDLLNQLQYDNQTMFYLIALKTLLEIEEKNGKVKGVRYNVVRKPLSGGKGSIRRHKPTKKNPEGESKAHYYQRLRAIIEEDPGNFFMRFLVDVSPTDVRKYEKQTLIPLLEQICMWWDWVSSKEGRKEPFANSIHWRNPYGIFDPLSTGNAKIDGDVDNYLNTGNEVGLERSEVMFPELAED